MTIREKLESELSDLVGRGAEIAAKFQVSRVAKELDGYQNWYTRSLAVIKALMPDRLKEFTELYHGNLKIEKDVNPLYYGIDHYLLGVRVQHKSQHTTHFDHETVVLFKFSQQIDILESAKARLNDILSDIRGVIEAELLDTELDSARELLKSKYIRASGTIAGVVLERHLKTVAAGHGMTTPKKNPNISDWNNALKSAGVVDIPIWRNIQRLYDLRTLCCHDKEREPTHDEVQELIDGTDKLTKTLI